MRYVFLAVALIATPASGHYFYEPECCDERDCEPLAPEHVEIRQDGYLIRLTGEVIPFKDARVSADNDYHWCRYHQQSTSVIQPYDTESKTYKKPCFYAPPGGV